MSFVALHRGPNTLLAARRLWLGAGEASALADASELLARIEAVLAAREDELARSREAAAAEGREAGRREALAAGAQALASSWQRAADEAALQAAALHDAVLALALQVVQRIVGELAPADVMAALAERAGLALLPPRRAVVRVHPEVAAAVQARLAALADAKLDVRSDASLALYDCEFETPAGRVIAGLPDQLARVHQALQGDPP
jgi:flagellar biosynthesis/type III secretory pathway protein FliH